MLLYVQKTRKLLCPPRHRHGSFDKVIFTVIIKTLFDMKAIKKSIFLAAFVVLSLATHAQEQGLRWGKWSAGRKIGNSLMDRVVDSYIDSIGNTYIFGAFGMDARLGENGPQICPLDTGAAEMGYMIEKSQGVFLAKIDSLVNILWCVSSRKATQAITH